MAKDSMFLNPSPPLEHTYEKHSEAFNLYLAGFYAQYLMESKLLYSGPEIVRILFPNMRFEYSDAVESWYDVYEKEFRNLFHSFTPDRLKLCNRHSSK